MESSFVPIGFDIFQIYEHYCGPCDYGSKGKFLSKEYESGRLSREALLELLKLVESRPQARFSIWEEIYKLMMRETFLSFRDSMILFSLFVEKMVKRVSYYNGEIEEGLDPNFGESAIGRVAPVDSGLWWIILLRAYGKITGDYSLQERIEVQIGIKLILNLCLTDGFDMFSTLLVTDGSCMIDRRIGINGHPLEIQVC